MHSPPVSRRALKGASHDGKTCTWRRYARRTVVTEDASGKRRVPGMAGSRAGPTRAGGAVGKTQLRYQLRCIDDLHKMLKAHGDWMALGSADEQKPATEGTVEAWGRSAENPVKGWYGTKKGLRGRFGMYVPPVLEVLGLAELEHNPKNNRMRAL